MTTDTESGQSERVIVIDEPEYTASYHNITFPSGEVMLMVHLEVFYYSHSILRQLLRQWDEWRPTAPATIFCMGDQDDAKFAGFVSLFGFEPLRPCPCTDNKSRMVFVNYGR
jgi:hypothetical protein